MLIIFGDYSKTDKDKVTILLALDNIAFNAAAQLDDSALCACNQTCGVLKLKPTFKIVHKIDCLDGFP